MLCRWNFRIFVFVALCVKLNVIETFDSDNCSLLSSPGEYYIIGLFEDISSSENAPWISSIVSLCEDHNNRAKPSMKIGYILKNINKTNNSREEIIKNPHQNVTIKKVITFLFIGLPDNFQNVGEEISSLGIPVISDNGQNTDQNSSFVIIKQSELYEALFYGDVIRQYKFNSIVLVNIGEKYKTFVESQLWDILKQENRCVHYVNLNSSKNKTEVKKFLKLLQSGLPPQTILYLWSEERNAVEIFRSVSRSHFLTKTVWIGNFDWSGSQQLSSLFHMPYGQLKYNSRKIDAIKQPYSCYNKINFNATSMKTLLVSEITVKSILRGLYKAFSTRNQTARTETIRKYILTSDFSNISLNISYYKNNTQPGFHWIWNGDISMRDDWSHKINHNGSFLNNKKYWDRIIEEDCQQCVSCNKVVMDVLPYDTTHAIVVYVLIGLGGFATTSILIIFYVHRNTPFVKASQHSMSLIQLFAHFMLFVVPLMFLGRPYEALCIGRPITIGILFTFIMAMTLTKTQKLVFIFHARIRMSKKQMQMSKTMEISLIFLMLVVQSSIACVSYFMKKSPVIITYDSVAQHHVSKCNTEEELFIQLLFGFLLILMCMMQAFKARHLPENFNETKLIFLTMLLCVMFSFAAVPFHFYVKQEKFKLFIDVILLLVINHALLVTMYGHKCWIILFRPARNTTTAFKENIQSHVFKGVLENRFITVSRGSSNAEQCQLGHRNTIRVDVR